MKTINFILILSSIVFLAAVCMQASALSIDVIVEKNFTGEIKEMENKATNGLVKISFEFLNSGSLPYSAHARMDLMENGKSVCTSWSDGRSMSPGDRAYFSLFCMADHSGKVVPRIRVYYANEIMEKFYPEENIIASGQADFFQISNALSGSDYITFDVVSPESTDVVITAESYLPGWSFHQVTAHLIANVSSKQKLYYESDILMNNDALVSVSSLDGTMFSRQPVQIRTEEGSLGKFIDQILGFFSSVLKT